MRFRQKRLYRDRCDLYRITDSKVPSFRDVVCLLVRSGVHAYGFEFSELRLNEDRWYFPKDQEIGEGWVICLKTVGHVEEGERWLIRQSPRGRGGRVAHWEVVAERHLIAPNPLI